MDNQPEIKPITSRVDSKPLPVVRGRRASGVQRPVAGRPERLRLTIQTGMLLSLLEDIAAGKKQVESHQVTAALGLLRKVLPDLQATMISGDPNLPLTIITRAE